MLRQLCPDVGAREKVLAEGLKEVAAELRLIDPADFVAFIRTERFGNIRSLVNASTEMYFKPGTISFSLAGRVDLRWDGNPSISLDMEFHHQQVDVFFRLVLEDAEAGVDIQYISFGAAPSDPEEDTQRLAAAMADARLAPAVPPAPVRFEEACAPNGAA